MLPEIVCRLKDFEARIASVVGMFGADFGGGFFYAGFGDVEDGRVACFLRRSLGLGRLDLWLIAMFVQSNELASVYQNNYRHQIIYAILGLLLDCVQLH